MTSPNLSQTPAKVLNRIQTEKGYSEGQLTRYSEEVQNVLSKEVAERVEIETVVESHKDSLTRFYLDGQPFSLWQFRNGQLAHPVTESRKFDLAYYEISIISVKRPSAKTTHFAPTGYNTSSEGQQETLCGTTAPANGWEFSRVQSVCTKCQKAYRVLTSPKRTRASKEEFEAIREKAEIIKEDEAE